MTKSEGTKVSLGFFFPQVLIAVWSKPVRRLSDYVPAGRITSQPAQPQNEEIGTSHNNGDGDIMVQ